MQDHDTDTQGEHKRSMESVSDMMLLPCLSSTDAPYTVYCTSIIENVSNDRVILLVPTEPSYQAIFTFPFPNRTLGHFDE